MNCSSYTPSHHHHQSHKHCPNNQTISIISLPPPNSHMAAPQKQPPPPPPPPSSTRSQTFKAMASPMVNKAASPISLQPSTKKDPSKSAKFFRRFRAVFRSFPILTVPSCKMPVSVHGNRHGDGHIHGGTRMTGTLFGFRKARVNLVIQENSGCLPMLVLELGIPTGKLLQDMGMGLVRIALECEKRQDKTKMVDEPIWALFCNGKKSGYGVKREATEDDLSVMQLLHAVSMGAGVIPNDGELPEGELMYMRAQFERVIGSKDSETYYMKNPDGNNGPELSIFFVRV